MRIVADKNIHFVETAFSKLGQVHAIDTGLIQPKTVKDAEILLVRSDTKVDASLLANSKIRFLGTASTGFDHVDLDYLQRMGIAFAHAPGSNANSVAEYVVAALLLLGEKFGFQLEGKSIGVVGVGNVGSRVMEMVSALGLRVLQNDPPKACETGSTSFLSLDDLMECDVVTLHVPLTNSGQDATYHLFDEKRFAKLKSGCVFINTSRGAVVDSNALKEAIKRGKPGFTVLDVWENEPNPEIELIELATIGTSHIAGYAFDGKVKATEMLFKQAAELFGSSKSWVATNEMPPADPDIIQVRDSFQDAPSLLHHVVQQCYDPQKDDRELRHWVSLPESERAQRFARLRKEYRIRREFYNTTVVLPNPGDKAEEILKILGFKISIKN